MSNKLVLLTGFLGAGKTTFLNHILKEFEGSKVGLIVNEFSNTGVDGALIRKDIPGTTMVELNNGSIFCACIKDSFTDSLVEMGSRDLEYVFVEASGLADPSSITSTLDQIRDLRGVIYYYQGAICLVDAVNFAKHSKVLVSLQRQVIYSRAAVLNKTDLVDDKGLSDCVEAIRAIRPDIPIYLTTFAQVSLREILDAPMISMPAASESTNTEATRPVTKVLVTTEAVDEEALRAFLADIAPSTYRVKGFVRTASGPREVSMVGTICRIEPWPEEIEKTELVIIASVGVRIVSDTLRAAKGRFLEKIELN
ncbi:MAG: GTP-binding protein [Oscillospiraceae bacterium]|nr:GTP-binding protein [Oscillospiraceae bacterium]